MKVDLFAPPGRPGKPFEWLVEPLADDPSFMVRPMFGVHACYVRGRMVIVLCGKREEPWHGLLVPTVREHHASLRKDFPALAPHEVLGKWLYLSAAGDEFEDTAHALVQRVSHDDLRIGIEPKSAQAVTTHAPPRSRTRARKKRPATR
jgi:hypothetical protein